MAPCLFSQLTDACTRAIGQSAGSSPAPTAALLALAQAHDVAGLVADLLLDGPSDPDLQEGLAIYLEGLRLEADRARRQLTDLLAALASRGLPVMPFKGPVLAGLAYAKPWLRPILDLDLLVHPDDVPHILACLTDAGFVHQPGLEPEGVAALRRYAGEYILHRADSLPVEPHWLPAPQTMALRFDVEAIWRRAQPTDWHGAPCYFPSPEDHLLLLVLHGSKEHWHKLKWIIDIAAFLRRHPTLDVPAVRKRALGDGQRRMLDLALMLAHRLGGAPQPASNPATRRLAQDVIDILSRPMRPPNPYRLSSFQWRLREHTLDRVRYVGRTLLTPRVAHVQRLKLPPALNWLHVPLKLPWDLLVTPALRCLKTAQRRIGDSSNPAG